MKLLEREQATAAAADALAGASRGKASAVFLVAGPGLGKTRVLNECCAKASGFGLGRASCSELEQTLPFGMLDRLLGPFGAGAAGAGAAGSAADMAGSAQARLRRYTGILEWLRGSAPSPLLLVVDDLHWADVDSVELLSLLCRRLEGLRVAVVATARPWPSGAVDQARSLVHDGFAVMKRLEPLSEAASVALLGQRLGAEAPESFARAAYKACAGNPLLLGEVAEARRRGEDLVRGPAGKLGEQIFLPRFAGVGLQALRWARVASVLGTRFQPGLVSRLSGQSEVVAAGAMESLCRAGLVRSLPGGRAEFVHPLFRQALYDDLAPPTRQGLHAGAMLALLEQGAPPAEAAPHAVNAGPRGDVAKVVDVLVSAGRQALAAGAVGTAVGHFEAAFGTAGTGAEPSLLLELASACLLTGKLSLATETLGTLFSQSGLHDLDRVAGTRLQARLLLATARYPEAKLLLEKASELASPYDPDLAAEILLDSVFLGTIFEGPGAVRETVQRALRIVEGSATATGALRLAALYANANVAFLGGDHSCLDDIAAAARAELERKRRRSAWSWDIVFGYLNMCKLAERFDQAQSMAELLLADAERDGDVLKYQSVSIAHADTLWRLGRLQEEQELVAPSAEMSDLVPTHAALISLAMAHGYHERGDQAESARWRSQIEAHLARMGESPFLRLWLCVFSCRDMLRAGRISRAVLAADRAWSTAQVSGLLEPCLVPWPGAAIEAYVAAGQLDRATELVATLDEMVRPLVCRAPRAVAAWGRAIIAWRRGNLGEAENGFQEALEHNAAVPMPLAEAETLIAYGRFLRHTGRPVRARQVLHRALDVLEPTGAGRLQAIAHDELGVAGGRRKKARPASELTAKESQVTGLAAQGLTNSQIAKVLFLSAKTVDHHLSRAYRKLGVRSRRDLMLVQRDKDLTCQE